MATTPITATTQNDCATIAKNQVSVFFLVTTSMISLISCLVGHESSSCPKPKSSAAKQCYECQQIGHIQTECPLLFRRRSVQIFPPKGCYHCGQTSHVAQFCQYAVYTGMDHSPNSGSGHHSPGTNGLYNHQPPIPIQTHLPSPSDILYPFMPHQMPPMHIDPAAAGPDNSPYYPSYFSLPPTPAAAFSPHMLDMQFQPAAAFMSPDHLPHNFHIPICYSCGAHGHRNKECPIYPVKSCHKCGKTGHIVSSCLFPKTKLAVN